MAVRVLGLGRYKTWVACDRIQLETITMKHEQQLVDISTREERLMVCV